MRAKDKLDTAFGNWVHGDKHAEVLIAADVEEQFISVPRGALLHLWHLHVDLLVVKANGATAGQLRREPRKIAVEDDFLVGRVITIAWESFKHLGVLLCIIGVICRAVRVWSLCKRERCRVSEFRLALE